MNRSIRAEYLNFNDDATLKKATPPLRGGGVVNAKSELQLDRYSAISAEGAAVSFLDNSNKFEGWKISLSGKNAWVQFSKVDFGKKNLKSVNVRPASAAGASVEIHLDTASGPLLARVAVGK